MKPFKFTPCCFFLFRRAPDSKSKLRKTQKQSSELNHRDIMPALGFSVFHDKVKNGKKRQTIRRHRKQPIKVGDTLYLYLYLRRKDCHLPKNCKMR